MDFTKKLNKVSFPEIALRSLILLFVLNSLAYLIFTLIFKIQFYELFSKSWIILIFTPLSLGVIHSFMSKNGIITIDSQDKTTMLFVKIDALLKQREYQVIKSNNGNSIFEYKSVWKRFISLNRGKVIISSTRDNIEIYGSRDILFRIATKLKYDKGL